VRDSAPQLRAPRWERLNRSRGSGAKTTSVAHLEANGFDTQHTPSRHIIGDIPINESIN